MPRLLSSTLSDRHYDDRNVHAVEGIVRKFWSIADTIKATNFDQKCLMSSFHMIIIMRGILFKATELECTYLKTMFPTLALTLSMKHSWSKHQLNLFLDTVTTTIYIASSGSADRKSL